MAAATESTTKTCQLCDEQRPAAFDTGNGYLMCEPCAMRDGLVRRGELKASLDMLGSPAATHASAVPRRTRCVALSRAARTDYLEAWP